MTFKSITYAATSIDPANFSPILKVWATIYLDPSIPSSTLSNPSDFTAYLECIDAGCTYDTIEIFIRGIDATAKTMEVKFPGAPTGNYKILIEHSVDGYYNTNALEVETYAIVTGISANSGSEEGG